MALAITPALEGLILGRHAPVLGRSTRREVTVWYGVWGVQGKYITRLSITAHGLCRELD